MVSEVDTGKLMAEQHPTLKPLIVHVIDSLARGGAETLLVNLLPELNKFYEIVLVTLTAENDFEESQIVCKQRYKLGYNGPKSIFSCVLKLRKIIKTHQPSLVRSQLYTSSLIARMATPKMVPLVFSIHTFQGIENYTKNRLSLPVEKLTYSRRHHLIGVSNQAIEDFKKYVGIKGPTHTLYNFINAAYFQNSRIADNKHLQGLRLIAVGNLKGVKNYGYMIDAFSELKHLPISLDIYGEGPLREELQQKIDQANVNIRLKGSCKEVYNIMPDYDLYVMSSLYEGFGIAPVEAMATGLPLLLSDLPVLREITHGNALFFDQLNPETFVKLLNEIMAGKHDLSLLSASGINLASKHYHREGYITQLHSIYQQVMGRPKMTF
ncbi:MAG: glycosyltransferase [Chitinophagaceae bacterium]|nr:MAG: glycosyltransferase [Chitinophagaceae bacterium]